MAQQGRLVEWNDERGFGFIEGPDGKRHFVHISAIGRIATRPQEGDRVSFVQGSGTDGRPQARSVRILGANPVGLASRQVQVQRISAWRDWRFPFAMFMLAILIFGLVVARIPPAMGLAYLVMGAISVFAYGADKSFAQSGQWRISEVTLLGVDLCFGIIGGLLGQAAFRHKTKKSDFVVVTLLISAVHLLWLGGLALGLIAMEDIVHEVIGTLSVLG